MTAGEVKEGREVGGRGAEGAFGRQGGREGLRGDGRAARAAGAVDVPVWWPAKSPAAFSQRPGWKWLARICAALGNRGKVGAAPAAALGAGRPQMSLRRHRGLGLPGIALTLRLRGFGPRASAAAAGFWQNPIAGDAGMDGWTDRRTRHSTWRGGLHRAAACGRVSQAAASPGFANCRSAAAFHGNPTGLCCAPGSRRRGGDRRYALRLCVSCQPPGHRRRWQGKVSTPRPWERPREAAAG